jgi:HK97 family phage major capsid protein
MTLNTTTGAAILTPEQVQSLVIEPLQRQSVALQVSTVVQTSSPTTRFPVVVSDPVSGWTAEGAEINISGAVVQEIEVTPKKLASLTIVSNELVDDSDPSALAVVGAGVVRDLQVRLDAAYFGTTTANGPSGIHTIAYTPVAAGTYTNLDPFAEALSKAETVGSTITAWVAHPTTKLQLQQLKIGTAYNQPLLGTDPSSPTKNSILGVPLYWSPAVGQGAVWGIPQAKSFVVLRKGAQVETDRSAFFSSDRTAVRATLRIGFAWPHPAAVVYVGTGGS